MSSSQGRRRLRVPRAASVRKIAGRLAAVMGAVTALSVVAALALSPLANHSEYENSPAVVAVILLAVIALLAALICTALLLALAVWSGVAWLRRRARAPGAASRGGSGSPAGSRLSGPGPR